MAEVKSLDGELIVDVGYYDITVIGLKAAVYYCKVTVIKACSYHGVTHHAPKKSGLRIADKVTVEVQAVTQIVCGGAWKACLDARSQLQGLGLGELGLEDLYI